MSGTLDQNAIRDAKLVTSTPRPVRQAIAMVRRGGPSRFLDVPFFVRMCSRVLCWVLHPLARPALVLTAGLGCRVGWRGGHQAVRDVDIKRAVDGPGLWL